MGALQRPLQTFLGGWTISMSTILLLSFNTDKWWVVTTSAWVLLKTECTKQLLDILHVLWEIMPGIQFATTELLKADLHPAHHLHLAWQYGLLD